VQTAVAILLVVQRKYDVGVKDGLDVIILMQILFFLAITVMM
jgi:hypothetical protein